MKPAHVRFLYYEIELGLVLKRETTRGFAVTRNNLHEFVAGLVIVNDYSARDVQLSQLQFYKGKSYRTFGPVGPYLCLLEPQDFAQLKRLQLTLTVNGQVRQKDSTAHLVFGPAETLTELTHLQDLGAGDLIATGTPSGCALAVPSPLKQRIAALLPEKTVSPDGTLDLGVQRNRVVDEARASP